MFAELCEVAMIVAFGAAWPASILRSYRARTARGKSIGFLFLVEFGYLCGIVGKLFSGNVNYVITFYLINLVAVMIDICLYFRNRKLDNLALVAAR